MENGDPKQAVRRYRSILKQAPNVADLWVNLGVAYARMHRISEARKAWNRALSVDADHKRARAYLAQTSTNR